MPRRVVEIDLANLALNVPVKTATLSIHQTGVRHSSLVRVEVLALAVLNSVLGLEAALRSHADRASVVPIQKRAQQSLVHP